LHHTERPTRGTFHAGRGHDYRTHDVEMHISEIGLCSGHSSSGVWVDENAQTTVPGLYAAGDMACVPHNYMIGAFVFGELAGTHASEHVAAERLLPEDQISDAHELIYRPLRNPDGPPQPQVEYKLRRFVNDYVAPPKSGKRLELAVETFQRMEGELERMGARTPHELMRCAEVTFIRDCAELAARASLVREESRWGLYHDRADAPLRDDDAWFFHLNIRRRSDGGTDFLKRPVAPYVIDVDEFTPPAVESLDPVPLVSFDPAVRRSFDDAVADAAVGKKPDERSPRLLELMALADATPALGELRPYLDDPDPKVRRSAVATLTEVVPEGFGPALVGALTDTHASVRRAAATALRELVEVLPADADVEHALRDSLSGSDPIARAAALDVLRALRLGDRDLFRAAAGDEHQRARLRAVRGLVSLDDVDGVAAVAADPVREVRVAVAHGLGSVGLAAGVEPLTVLASDADALVRAAALEASAGLGCPEPLLSYAVAAVGDDAWQVRVGAVRGLGGGDGEVAVPLLAGAVTDPHADVRKAAVIALGPLAADARAADALERAGKDTDADVRGYARRALERAREPASA
ncbi:MAG: HEAT repeat domain-containing protein, partial [Nocardioidaceae bacterium]